MGNRQRVPPPSELVDLLETYTFTPLPKGDFFRVEGGDSVVYARVSDISRIEVIRVDEATYEVTIRRKRPLAKPFTSRPMMRSEVAALLETLTGEKDFPQHVPLYNNTSPS